MSKYTVETVGPVTIVWADEGLGITALGRITQGMPKEAVMDIGMAARIGAFMVMGLAKDLDAYKSTNPPAGPIVIAEIAQAGTLYCGEALKEIENFLDGYDRGQSSNALLQCTSGINCISDARSAHAHPHDKSDIGRCVRLYLGSSVVREHFHKTATLSDDWRATVENWSDTLASFDQDSKTANSPTPK